MNPRKHPIFLAFALILATLAGLGSPATAQFGGFGQDESFGDSRDGMMPKALAARTTVERGGNLPIVIALEHSDGWHSWTNAGNDPDGYAIFDGAIRTSLTIATEPAGAITPNLGLAQWPEAHGVTMNLSGTPETFAVFEGRALVSIPMTVPDDAPLGATTITITVGYQTCDDAQCLMPWDETLTIPVTIVDAAADADPISTTGDFADFPMDRFPAEDAIDPTLGIDLNTDGPYLDSRESVRINVRSAVARVAPGEFFPVLVTFEFKDGFHAWLNEGNDPEGTAVFETAIRTEITAEAGTGIRANTDKAAWPEHHVVDINLLGTPEPYAVLEGTAPVLIPVEVLPDTALGASSITLRFTYQTCDDTNCQNPVFDQEVTLPFEVVAAGESDSYDASGDFAAWPDNVLLQLISSEAGDADGDADGASEKSGIDFKKAHWWVAFGFIAISMFWLVGQTIRISKRPIFTVVICLLAAAVTYGSYTFVRGITATPEFWEDFDRAAFDEALNNDEIVFVKFTAAWCANCQVNERLITSNEEAVALLSQPDIRAFKVKFDGPNPEGEALKAELGGGGIPLIGVWHPDVDDPTELRGQLVGAQPVIDALQGGSFEAAEGEHVFDFLGIQFSVGQDAILIIMGLAFIAGFLMNFTPCVLPVIPIKILSLQAHAKHPAKCFYLGVIFSLGIIALYALIGVLMAGFVTGVEKLDWGQQFQSWWLNAIIALVIAAMGIGLLGLFDIKLPNFLYMFNPQSDTASGSFFMGVFTAILSTPCTGPLLGATVAWVATQTPFIAFITLVVMGCGMAFPYILLTAKPSLLAKLPKSGPGSNVIKQVMGLLLLAVASYFIGVTYNALASDGNDAAPAAQTAPADEEDGTRDENA